ncbi:MAG: hypothetical protein HY275_06220 [Gemmatimonadetes bacterium]|nr:hypothetical protein [Gemmatimonadota bacterium]
MFRLLSTRTPLTTLAVAGVIALAGCAEKSIVAPQNVTRVNRTGSGLFVASVGDYTWFDANGNGIQDAGEPIVPNVTLNLYVGTVCGGTPLMTTTSDPINGFYLFAGMDPGTYSVEAVTPTGMTPTIVNAAGSTSENDSNPACSTVTLGDGEFNGSYDFGYVNAVKPTQGCTPGYWKNHKAWPTPYKQSQLFSAYFDDAFPGKTLQQVLSQGGGGLNALGRQTVSALLNSMAIGTPKYGLTTSQVISQFNAAYESKVYEPTKNYFESLTDSYSGITCPLN